MNSVIYLEVLGMNKEQREALIIKFAVDINGLSAEETACFTSDITCKTEAEALSADLEKVGQLSDALMPEPRFLPDLTRSAHKTGFQLMPALTFALIAICIAVSSTFYLKSRPDALPVNLDMIYAEIEKDALFMSEVETMVESTSYSGVYPENGEVKYEFSDEFMEAVVPI